MVYSNSSKKFFVKTLAIAVLMTLNLNSAFSEEANDTSNANTVTLYNYNESTNELTSTTSNVEVDTTYGEGNDKKEFEVNGVNGGTFNIEAKYDFSYSGDTFNSVVYDESDMVNSLSGNFVNQTGSDFGAAINNKGLIGVDTEGNIIGGIDGNFINNRINFNNKVKNGGTVISNYGSIGYITANFINNSNESSFYWQEGMFVIGNFTIGGAIYNKGTIGDITGNFVGNRADVPGKRSEGGAIYNNGIMGNIIGSFIGNYAKGDYGFGGAIYNEASDSYEAVFNKTAKIGNITGDFIGNYADGASAAYGGGIYNYAYAYNENTISLAEIGDITGNFIGNHSKNSSYPYGGAITNTASSYDGKAQAKIGNINGNFIGNYIDSTYLAYGGAIYNSGNISTSLAEIGDITGNFIGNYAKSSANNYGLSYGGAIYNTGKIGKIKGNFIGNYVNNKSYYAYGGAIYNTGTIKEIEGDFIENHVTSLNATVYAGALYMRTMHEGTIKGKFIGNYAYSETGSANGGAFYTAITQDLIGDFIANHAESKESNALGGAINYYGSYTDSYIGSINGNYVNNYAKSTNGKAQGGAIYDNNTYYHTATIKIGNINGNFTANHAESENGDAEGGALWISEGLIGDITANFRDNYVYSKNSEAKGGAIYKFGTSEYDDGKQLEVIKGSLINNSAITDGGNALGGAIYTNSDLTMLADNNAIKIQGNYVSTDGGTTKDYQAIYVAGTLNGEGEVNATATLTFEARNGGSITLNDYVTGDNGYKVVLTGDENSKINLLNNLDNANVTAEKVNINLSDNTSKTYEFASLNSDASAKYAIDINTDSNTSDKIIAGADSTGIVYIDSINIIGAIPTNTLNVKVIDSESTSLQIAINSQISDKSYAVGTTTKVLEPEINENMYFDEVIYQKLQQGQLFGNIAAVTSDKENIYDSLSIAINNELTKWGDIIQGKKLGDTLALIGQFNTPNNKTFNFKTSQDVYNVSDNLGVVAGSLTVNGISDENGSSTINLDNHKGFELNNASTLNLNEVTLEGNNTLITVSNSDAEVNLDGVTLNGNIDSTTSYKLGIYGETTLNGSVGNANATLYNGILTLPSNNHLANADLIVQSGTLNLVNNQVQNQIMNSLTVNGNLNLFLDADLAARTMDRLPVNTTVADGAMISVQNINLLSDAQDVITSVPFAYDSFKNNVQYTGAQDLIYNGTNTIAYSPIYKYSVNYDDSNGNFVFTRGANSLGSSDAFNPAVLPTSVSAQSSGYATMNQTFTYAFQHADNYMVIPALERMALKNENKYAFSGTGDATDAGVFSPLYTEAHQASVWIKPYSSFESIPLKNGPKVSSNTYGTLIGFGSNIQECKHGWDRVWTGYVGYNGASQHFAGVDSVQNGGLIGSTLSLYKGNFFNGLTVTTGASVANNTTMYGKEEIPMLLVGVANKTGYNIELFNGHLILQPNMLLSYTYVNTFNYKNAAGVKIDSEPLHAIQLSPGIKIIGHTENHWQPYIGVNMIWNILDKQKVTANGVRLPEMSVKPYVQYGVGIQRRFKDDRMMAFGQAMIQNGGRNGISLTAGIRWFLGDDFSPKQVYSSGLKKYIKANVKPAHKEI